MKGYTVFPGTVPGIFAEIMALDTPYACQSERDRLDKNFRPGFRKGAVCNRIPSGFARPGDDGRLNQFSHNLVIENRFGYDILSQPGKNR